MSERNRPLQTLLAGAGVSRRAFLLATIAGALAAVGCDADPDGGPAASALPDWLTGAVGEPEAAARIGRLYLEAYPAERNTVTLVAGVDTALGPHLEADAPDMASMLEALQRAVCDDYIHNQVVSLSGWMFSRTEARVYAALALASDA